MISNGFSDNRKLSDSEKAAVRSMSADGVPVAAIRSTLQSQFLNNRSTRKDIHNEISRSREEFLDGRQPIVALYQALLEKNWFLRILTDASGSIVNLFAAHPESVALARRFPSVYLIDCTYKTNRYKMPMMNMIGIASTFSTFNIGFAFLQAETMETYKWALRALSEISVPSIIATDRELALINAIPVIFPNAKNILCQWHINKNFVAKCARFFPLKPEMQQFENFWQTGLQSSSEEEFDSNWQSLVRFSTSSGWQSACRYLQDIWLPYKTRFVKCWVDRLMHFGTYVTSRCEGNHAMIKRFLGVANGDLLAVYKKLCLAIDTQHVELNQKMDSDKVNLPEKYKRCPLMKRQLVGKVSRYALRLISKQLDLAQDFFDDQCSGEFTRIWGLPCKHIIRDLIDSGRDIGLQDVHVQWWLSMDITELETSQNTLVAPDALPPPPSSPKTRALEAISKKLDTLSPEASAVLLSRLHAFADETPIVTFSAPSAVANPRGKPAGSKRKSNKRSRSEFEIVLGKKCGNCRRPGHYSNTCPN